MERPLFARVPPSIYQDLLTICAAETVVTGRRVSIRETIIEAISDLASKNKTKNADRITHKNIGR